MNEELKQTAQTFSEDEINLYNLYRRSNISPDVSVQLVLEKRDLPQQTKDRTLGEALASGAKQTISGLNEARKNVSGQSLARGITQAGTELAEGNVGGAFSALIQPSRSFLKGAADIVRGVSDIAGGVIETADDVVTGGALGRGLSEATQHIVSQPEIESIIKKLGTVNQATGGTFGDVATIASVLPISRLAGTAWKAATSGVVDGTASISRAHLKSAPIKDYIKNTAEQVYEVANPTISGVMGGVSQGAKNVADRIGTALERQSRISALPELEATAIRQGIPDTQINTIKVSLANPAEKTTIKKLVDNASSDNPDQVAKIRTQKEIIGEEMLKPVVYLAEKRKQVGEALGTERNKLSTKTVDTKPVYDSFIKHLKDEYDVKVNNLGEIISKGRLGESTTKDVQKILDELYSNRNTTQKELDNWLRATLEDYDIVNKMDKTRVPDQTVNIISNARSTYKSLMPDNYNSLLEEYAKVISPLGEMAKKLKVDNWKELPDTSLKAGELARRLAGEASSDFQKILDDVVAEAVRNGYEGGVDLRRLVEINKYISDLYELVPGTGLQGSVSSAISSIPTSVSGAVMNTVGEILTGKATREQAQKAFAEWIATQ